MVVPRDVVAPLLLSLFCGCGTGSNVLLGDLPENDAALGQEDAAPDGAGMDGGPLFDATFEATTDGRGCTSGEPVPAPLRAFLAEAMGFGRAATGGLSGCLYHVTTLAESGPGSLREGVDGTEPRWIVFDVTGSIELTSAITAGSNKTIDGRGNAITVRNLGLNLGAGVSNVVIENVTFVGNSQGSNNDAIQIADGANTIWIDHCSLSSYGDGLIDITHAATDVTVSWCVFSKHEYVMLIGGNVSDIEDVNIRVTMHHNWWNQTVAYAPRLRFGKAHVLNNFIDRWVTAASASTMYGEILSEYNVFAAGVDKVALATKAGNDDKPGRAKTLGDLLRNNASTETFESDLVFQPPYPYTPVRADDELQNAIMDGAGALPH